jgi:hypothetical protein
MLAIMWFATEDKRLTLRLVLQIPVKNILRTLRIPNLRIERRARVMRDHPVSSAERVRHRAPRVITGRRLHIPHIARIPIQLARAHSGRNGVGVADRTAGSVDKPGTLLEMREQLGVHKPTGALVERCVDGDDVTLGYEVLDRASSELITGLYERLRVPTLRSATRRAFTSFAACSGSSA